MKNVGWRDILIALVLAPFLVLPVIGLAYFVMHGVLDVSDEFATSFWLSMTLVATCVVEALILAVTYEGEDRAIEHGWAWLAVAAIIAAVALIPYAAGVLTKDSAIDVMKTLYVNMAMVFLVVMLSVFINARRGRLGLNEACEVDAL